MKTERKEEQIEEIMECFDFIRVHAVMLFLKWTWLGSKFSPQVGELQAHARYLLNQTWEEGERQMQSTFISGGGFTARYEKWMEGPVLSLAFEVSEHRFIVDNSGSFENTIETVDRPRRIDMQL